MEIELNETEIKLIDKALDTWEKEAMSSAMFGSLLTTVLMPKDKNEQAAEDRENSKFKAAETEAHNRRVKSTLLRAKLFQALNRASEFDAAL